MARSLDELIDFLLDEIALSGQHGCTPREILSFIDEFYASTTNSENRDHDDADYIVYGAQRKNIDKPFQEQVWKWLTRRPDVFVGSNGQFNKLTLLEVELRHGLGYVNVVDSISRAEASSAVGSDAASQSVDPAIPVIIAEDADLYVGEEEGASPAGKATNTIPAAKHFEPIRVYATEERMWYALCGHAKDLTRLNEVEFVLLSLIASRRGRGILQTDLVQASGQDKRNVPHRTDKLHRQGYIEKRGVIARACRTSRLILKRFAGSLEDDLVTQAPQSEDVPLPNKNTDLSIDFEVLIHRIFGILRTKTPITRSELKSQLDMTSPWRARVLTRIIREFEVLGCVKRIRADSEHSENLDWSYPCVKYIHDPTSGQLQTYYNAVADLDTNLIRNDEDDEQDSGISTTASNALQAVEKIVPQWNPGRILPKLISDVVHNAGQNGISDVNLRNATQAPFVRYLLNHFVAQLSNRWTESQPSHLRHLAVTRDTTMTGRIAHRAYYSFPNFKDTVEKGQASWQAVVEETGNQINGQTLARALHRIVETMYVRDRFGFPLFQQPKWQYGNGQAIVTDALKLGKPGYLQLSADHFTAVRSQLGEPTVQLRESQSNTIDSPWTSNTPARLSLSAPKAQSNAQAQSSTVTASTLRSKTRQVSTMPGKPSPKIKTRKTAKLPSKGRPRKFLRGTEHFWRSKFQRMSPGSASHPLFINRPPNFDVTLVQALNSGLPVPAEPEDINQIWVDVTLALLTRIADGLYISPRGQQPHSSGRYRAQSQVMILRSARLNEVDFSEKSKTSAVRFLSSSAAHTFSYLLYPPPTEVDISTTVRFRSSGSRDQDWVVAGPEAPVTPRGPELGVFYAKIPTNSSLRKKSFVTVPAPEESTTENATTGRIELDAHAREARGSTAPADDTSVYGMSSSPVPTHKIPPNHTATPASHRIPSPLISRPTSTLRIPLQQRTTVSKESVKRPRRHGSDSEVIPDLAAPDHTLRQYQLQPPLTTRAASRRNTSQQQASRSAVEFSSIQSRRSATDPEKTPEFITPESIAVTALDETGHKTVPHALAPKAVELSEVTNVVHPANEPGFYFYRIHDPYHTVHPTTHTGTLFVNYSVMESDAAGRVVRRGSIRSGQKIKTAKRRTSNTARESSVGLIGDEPLVLGDRPDRQDSDFEDEVERPKKRSKGGVNGGSSAVLRRKIILDIVEECGGAVPFDQVPLWKAYTTAWQAAGQQSKPDSRTIQTGAKSLCENGKLKKIAFAFKDHNGLMSTSNILAKAELGATHPVIRELQHKMSEAYPNAYTPPQMKIDEDIRSYTRRGDIQGLQTPHQIDTSSTSVETSLIPAEVRSKAKPGAAPRNAGLQRSGPNKARTLEQSKSPSLLDDLQAPDGLEFSNAQASEALRFDTNAMDNHLMQSPGRSTLHSGIPSTKRGRKSGSGSTKVVWKTSPWSGMLANCLQDILSSCERIVNRDHSKELDPDWSLFEWEVDAVASWEQKSEKKFEQKQSSWSFINHYTGKNFETASLESTPILFGEMLLCDPIPKAQPRRSARSPKPTASFSSTPGTRPRRRTAINRPYHSKVVTLRGDFSKIVPRQESTQSTSILSTEIGLPSKKRNYEPSAYQSRKRRRVEQDPEYISNKNGDRATVSNSFKGPIRRSRGTQHLRNMSQELIYRIVVTVVVVRTLTGGLDRHVDWNIVMLCFPNEDPVWVRERWKTLHEKFRRDIASLTDDLQEQYCDAYLDGNVPGIDFDNIGGNDWAGIVDWALKTLSKGPSRAIEDLPVSRDELAEMKNMAFQEHRGMRELLGYNINATLPMREAAHASIVFAKTVTASTMSPPSFGPDLLDKEDEQLNVAKSWALATALTTEEDFDAKACHAKLSKLAKTPKASEALLEQALKILTLDKAVTRNRESNAGVSGRSCVASKTFYESLDTRRTIQATLLRQAAVFKRDMLDPAFVAGDQFVFQPACVEDGDMIAVLNLVSSERIKVRIGPDVPKNRYGLSLEAGYQTRRLEKDKLSFTVLLEVVEGRYVFGDPIETQILPAPGLTGGEDEKAAIPIWMDIHGNFQEGLWELIVCALVGLVSTRPGVDAKELSKTLAPSLTLWETQTVLQWMNDSGIVEVSGKGRGSGWEVKEWWWLICGRAINQGEWAVDRTT